MSNVDSAILLITFKKEIKENFQNMWSCYKQKVLVKDKSGVWKKVFCLQFFSTSTSIAFTCINIQTRKYPKTQALQVMFNINCEIDLFIPYSLISILIMQLCHLCEIQYKRKSKPLQLKTSPDDFLLIS